VRWSPARAAILGVALAVVAAFWSQDAVAAPWCGSPTTVDRPPVVAGPTIRVVYAVPADGADGFAARAAQISSDVDEITAWWRTQDFEREPRFDVARFPCGLQADILTVRLGQTAAQLRPEPGRAERIEQAVVAAAQLSPWVKHVVYYDGPTDDDTVCGQGRGAQIDTGIAIVYVDACTAVPSAVVMAHELLHALGALPFGAPHACPDNPGHPCDSTGDILYPYVSGASLAVLALDVGHDDYYAHPGSWPDAQDSTWLRRVDAQLPLALTLVGTGTVTSDVPGIACAASCTTEWNPDAELALEATPGPGQRFVRWSGACTGEYGVCDLTLRGATPVTALFAPERFRLVVSLGGKGAVAGEGIRCRKARCTGSAVSYTPLRLTAKPAAGWRLGGWTGACTGRRAVCLVKMDRATGVHARFVRR
jgi:hypothetical protein